MYQVVKFNNSKKWQNQIIFMVELSIKSVFDFFSWNRFLRSDTQLFGLETAVLQTFRLPCYKFERIYLPTFPRPSGKCSTTHPCKFLLWIFFLKHSYASILFPLCSCFSKLQQESITSSNFVKSTPSAIDLLLTKIFWALSNKVSRSFLQWYLL